MANAQRGEVELKAGDETYTLRLNINAIAEIETILDVGINQISEMLSDPANFRIGTWRAVLWGALREHHKGITLEDAGEIIGKAGIPSAIEAMGKAMQLAFPEAEEGKENPQKASPAAG